MIILPSDVSINDVFAPIYFQTNYHIMGYSCFGPYQSIFTADLLKEIISADAGIIFSDTNFS